MTTNFYLVTDLPLSIDKDDTDDPGIHLGGHSTPGVFHVRTYPGKVDTFAQWAALVRAGSVVSEAGVPETAGEFLAWVEETARTGRLPRPQGTQTIDHGLILCPYAFC